MGAAGGGGCGGPVAHQRRLRGGEWTGGIHGNADVEVAVAAGMLRAAGGGLAWRLALAVWSVRKVGRKAGMAAVVVADPGSQSPSSWQLTGWSMVRSWQ